MTIQTAAAGVVDNRNTSKLAYYSDEEEDDAVTKNQESGKRSAPQHRPDWSASGRTQVTTQN